MNKNTALSKEPTYNISLQEALRAEFESVFGMGPSQFPDELVLRSAMGIGAVTYTSGGETRLGGNDEKYLWYGISGAKTYKLPIQFDGNYTAVNRKTGHDFLDYGEGVIQGETDVLFSCYIYHSTPSNHITRHPDSEWCTSDSDFVISPRIPYEQNIGDQFARSASAVRARAIIVFGGENTISVPQFAYDPYVYVGEIFSSSGRDSDLNVFCHPAHLLLDKTYLEQLTKHWISIGQEDFPLKKQPIPRKLHPHHYITESFIYSDRASINYREQVRRELGWNAQTRSFPSEFMPDPQA